MSEVVGEATLRFGVDRSSADSGLRDIEKDSERTGKSSGSKFSGSFKKALKVGAAGITAGLLVGGALVGIGAQFDDLSDTIQVSTGASGRALQGLQDDAEAVARRVPLAFDAIGPVIATLNQRLDLAGKPLQDLAEQFLDLQSITGEAVDTDAITGALNLFQVQGKDTGAVLDELFRVTQETGIGFNDLGGILARQGPALKQFGFSIEDSASLIGSLSKAGIDPSRTLGTLTRALSTFAKAGKDPEKALGGTIDKIQELIKAGDQAGAVDIAGKVFGTRGATQFVTAVQSGRLNLESLTKVTEGNRNTIVGATRDTEDFGEKLQLLKNRVLIALEPVATRVFNAVGDAITKVNTSGALPAIADGFRTVADRATPLIDKGIALGERVLPKIRDLFNEVAPRAVDLASAIGGDLITAVTDVGDVLGPFVDDLIGLGQRFVEDGSLDQVIGIFKGLGDVLTSVTGFLADHEVAVRSVLVAVGAVVAVFQIWQGVLAVTRAVTVAFTAVQAALNFVLSANPIGIIVLALVALAVGLIYAYKHSETFRNVVAKVGETISKVFSGIIDFFKDHWVLIVSLIGGPIAAAAIFVIRHFDDIKSKVSDVIGFIRDLPGKISDLAGRMKDAGKDFVKGLLNGILAGAKKVGGIVTDIGDAILDGIKALINGAIDLINNGIPDKIPLPGAPDINLPNNPIPHLANGTDSWRGGWSWVGEEGPELMRVPRGAQVVPTGPSAAMAAAAGGRDGVTIQHMTVMPHDYSEWNRQVLTRTRVSGLGTRRPIALAGDHG